MVLTGKMPVLLSPWTGDNPLNQGYHIGVFSLSAQGRLPEGGYDARRSNKTT